MNTMKLPTNDGVTHYIAAVRAELADLPPDDLDDLTGGLEADLSELVAESPSGVAGLASPHEYAAELRSAAGFPARAEPPKPTWWSLQKDQARRDVASLATDYPAVRQARDLAIELRPVWWLARGVVLAWLLVIWGSFSLVFYPLAIIGAVASVYVGRRRAELVGWPRRALASANAIAVLGLVIALVVALGASRDYEGYSSPEPINEPGLLFNGTPSSNLYVYDKDGRPLSGVRIFTDTGQPVDLAQNNFGTDGEPLRGPVDIYGHPWDNTFPVLTGRPPADPETDPDVWNPPSAIPPLGSSATATTAPSTTSPPGSPSATVTPPGGAVTTMPTTAPPPRPTSSLPKPTGTK